MNITNANNRGSPQDKIYFLMSILILPFIIITFIGTLNSYYSGKVWIGMLFTYIVYMIYRGVKQ